MRRIILVAAIALFVIAAAILAWRLTRPATETVQPAATSTLPTAPDAPTDLGKVTADFAATPQGSFEGVKTGRAAVSGSFALQEWYDDNRGGQALMKYEAVTSAWRLVTMGGGAWDEASLMAYGVPEGSAAALVAGIGTK